MKFPLSLDFRKATIAEGLAGVAVIDADGKRVMIIMPDVSGFYDHAAAVVDTLNIIAAVKDVNDLWESYLEGSTVRSPQGALSFAADHFMERAGKL